MGSSFASVAAAVPAPAPDGEAVAASANFAPSWSPDWHPDRPAIAASAATVTASTRAAARGLRNTEVVVSRIGRRSLIESADACAGGKLLAGVPIIPGHDGRAARPGPAPDGRLSSAPGLDEVRDREGFHGRALRGSEAV